MVDDTKVTIVWNKKVTDVERVPLIEIQPYLVTCVMCETRQCKYHVVLFQTCLMTCMDIQLRIMIWLCHQQLVRSLVLYVMFDFSFIITCLENALAFNIIFLMK